MQSFVYVLTILRTGHFYIGSTGDLKKRLAAHLWELKNGRHRNKKFQDVWRDDDILDVLEIETPSRDAAYDLEDSMIKGQRVGRKSHLLLNIGEGALPGDNMTFNPNKEDIVKRREATRRKIYESLSVEERKERFSRYGEKNPMYGRNHSDKSKQQMSEKKKGKSIGVGRKLSPSHVEKMRQRQKLRTGEKNSFFGKKHSEESRKRMSDAHKGKVTFTRGVVADGVPYKSGAEAARALNVCPATIVFRIKSKHYPNYFYQ